MSATEIPQWKKELIARLRSQNRRTAARPCPPQRSVHQPAAVSRERFAEQCEMVRDTWDWEGRGSDEEEDLRYGPGIVNRLRNKYLSLAQRENPQLRKAASLEHLLDEPEDPQPRTRLPDLKRARSVETISRAEEEPERPKSLQEEVLIACDGSKAKIIDMPDADKTYQRINRPKRIQPIMNEKEKPPVDVVKQAKLIFERRPEQRTRPPQQTGDVAAKVATYKNIIVQAKAKKPPIKSKPVGLSNDKPKTNGIRLTRSKPVQLDRHSPLKELEVNGPKSPERTPPSLPSPIPDVSRIEVKIAANDHGPKSNSLSETPDLITSSPLPAVNSPSFRIAATENFIREEKRFANLDRQSLRSSDSEDVKRNGPVISNTMTFNFAKTNKNSLPVVRNNALNTQIPLPPLKLEINGINNGLEKRSPPRAVEEATSPPSKSPTGPKPNLTILEIEKNLINTAKTQEQPLKGGVSIAQCVEEVTRIKVPKVKKPPRELENNSIVFKFTDRKDVPDYVHNDGITRVAKIEKPKVGEGGFIILPGASIDESFTDEDEEIMRSLEGPPSPCDVTFINDNILIDGKSSLNQKTKKAKMKISFVEEGPEIYEYPSESSLLIEEVTTAPLSGQMRHSVPSVTGSTSLGNYTPKSTEEFHPGVTRSVQNIPAKPESIQLESNELILQEVERPVLFSAGANSDILF